MEMKKCPFCNGEPEIIKTLRVYHIKCTKCEGRTKYFEIKEECIKAWNRRASVADE